jgi:hypothetical protein
MACGLSVWQNGWGHWPLTLSLTSLMWVLASFFDSIVKVSRYNFCASHKPAPGFPMSYLVVLFVFSELRWEVVVDIGGIRLFRIISIPSKFCYFHPPDHVISMELLALKFRCQCTQQKLQSICAVLTFDPQLKKIWTFSVKDRYQLNYFICIKDFNAETNTSLKMNLFSLFICAVSIIKGKRSAFMYIFLISDR